MRIRKARLRDAEAIFNLVPSSENITYDLINEKLQDTSQEVYVATDFAANILACALDINNIFVSDKCVEASVEDTLRSKY